MSPFLASLRRYLNLVDGQVEIDLPARRAHYLSVLDDLSAEPRPQTIGIFLRDFRPDLDAWCVELAGRLHNYGIKGAKVAQSLDVALSWVMGLPGTTGSFGLDIELKRMSAGIADLSISYRYIEPYAQAIQLVQTAALTRSGRIALDLPDREATRWLLTLELLQTAGPGDQLRIWPGLLQTMVRHPKHETDGWSARNDRLEQMNLIVGEDGHYDHIDVSVNQPSIALFQELLETPNTPFGVLAVALLQDLTSSRLAEIGQPAAPSSTSIASRHSQLVSHEVRNRLGPAKHAISDIRWSLQQGEPISAHLDRIDHAIDRTLQFVTHQQKIAQLAGPGEEAIDPRPAIEAAVTTAKNGVGAPVFAEITGELPPIRGTHEILVMVLLNVLRNALEAIRSDGGRVLLQATAESGDLRINIEDNGPGIPAGIVSHIFEPGFSTRQGNRGEGLALVRETLISWGGRIHHEPVKAGGARFILVLPGASKR